NAATPLRRTKANSTAVRFIGSPFSGAPGPGAPGLDCAGGRKTDLNQKISTQIGESQAKNAHVDSTGNQAIYAAMAPERTRTAPGEQVVDENEGSPGKCHSIRSGLVSAQHERFRFRDRVPRGLPLLKGEHRIIPPCE